MDNKDKKNMVNGIIDNIIDNIVKDNKMPIFSKMDEANKTAANVFNTQGEKAFLKHVFTDQETGRTMSYAEMRMKYG